MDNIMEMKEKAPLLSPFFPTEYEAVTVTKIGGTCYEVSAHFSKEGTETVLQQFTDLLREAKIL